MRKPGLPVLRFIEHLTFEVVLKRRESLDGSDWNLLARGQQPAIPSYDFSGDLLFPGLGTDEHQHSSILKAVAVVRGLNSRHTYAREKATEIRCGT